VTRNGAGRPPIDQKLRIFACTFAAPFQSVAPFWRIFSRHETRQGQNRGLWSDQMRASPRWHNRRCFKSLRASRESLFARALDASPACSSNQTIPLTKGRLPEASREVERVRCPRADLQSAPGRLGYQPPGIMTGARGASLDWDRRRRVTPVQTTSQEAWPEAEPLGWNNSLR